MDGRMRWMEIINQFFRAELHNMTKYITIIALGGLIDSIKVFDTRRGAVEFAKRSWKHAKYETDDIKVFESGGFIVWHPPQE
jgi:hypothetical protein